MFSFAPEIRKAIYTTNTIESLNMTLRKIIKNRAMFPSDEAVFKILYLALKNISKRWTMPIPNWSGAMNQFAILFENRLPSSSFQTGMRPNEIYNLKRENVDIEKGFLQIDNGKTKSSNRKATSKSPSLLND